jgi:hypothetical protein
LVKQLLGPKEQAHTYRYFPVSAFPYKKEKRGKEDREDENKGKLTKDASEYTSEY